ncbi:HAD-IA family hydrolase [Rhodobacteraceae bacterium B1Z28]|uniref:HAD-IA family hydrolase n=1 Tax=Ruegeria haliotis TaxID=2747601 RepID=A0ABX2PVB7_9RHOB|nr:HAD-IA family hydrolase [Ruegeria haliotis]NVO58119.1 HAD-IA family hydrolase [Ruegeria haliotis]
MNQPSVTFDTRTIVAWDFDGVLNRNIVNGRFIWADRFEIDIGHSLNDFTEIIFRNGFDEVITGKVDLRDRIEEWARTVNYTEGADALISYWFKNDALPDTEVTMAMDMLSSRGVRQIIVTNNEARRAAFIEREMGFGNRVEHVFASGRMGVRKPDPAFFKHVTDVLEVEPKQMLLVDDCPKNVPAAVRCGWRAFHFIDHTRDQLRKVLGLNPQN